MILLEVAVAAPIHQPLTYKLPEHIDPAGLAPGLRLLVPLGNRLVTGYLLGATDAAPPSGRLKSIANILDPAPLFPAGMIPFFRWLADYYLHPIGEVIKGALPGGLTTESGRAVTLCEEGRPHLAALMGQEEAVDWLATLLGKGKLPPSAVRRIWKTEERRLRKWQEQGFLTIDTVLRTDTVKAKSELCARLLDSQPTPDNLKAAETKTLAMLHALPPGQWSPQRELARDYPSARQGLRGLADKGLIELAERQVYRDPFGEPAPFFPKPETLSDEQLAALDQLLPAICAGTFSPFLLHGVTGSGKTEVYLRAAETTLAQGRAVLVLVPEIALAAQIEGHFVARFGDQVALLHSGLSAGERYDQWQRLRDGSARIAIGARSAIFAPLADLGLIIVDEEHDPAYKQEDNLRYHGRDIAVLRASQQQAVVILGSATPSVTSFFHASHGKYRLLNLTRRIENRPMPAVEVVDLRTVPTVSGHPPLFTNQLYRAIRQTLADGNQALVFLNRRGFASSMICQDCGHTVQCRNCQVTLTLHKGNRQLVCHYCGYATTSQILCANCQSPKVIGIGFGTERLEDELTKLFPAARIARLDRDTTSKRNEYLATLRAVHQGEVDILIGTQMITKGHHFPNVTLVGIVWADAGLGLPDFKAGERTYQLLSQVTGRAGRGDKPGRVIVQTHQPDHYSVITAQAHNYQALYEQELSLRKMLQYPPFSRLINLQLEGIDEGTVRTAAETLARKGTALAAGKSGLAVLGPAPSPLSRLRGRYRWQILLKGAAIESLHQLCTQLLQAHPVARDKNAVKLTVDVDPENML